MKVATSYSHLNGEEYLGYRFSHLFDEIREVVRSINSHELEKKISEEKRMKGRELFSPRAMNAAFAEQFHRLGWSESRYSYYITNNRELMEKSIGMTAAKQRTFLVENGEENPIYSYNQTDFVKDKIAVEVQFGKYAFVAYDLFVKHMLFYSGGVINLGVEILPTKKLQAQMSSGVAYYEGEVYNVMRQGRNSPPVPLLILGVEPE